MHYIIETPEQLEFLKKHSCYDSCFVNIIPGNDLYHPKLIGVSCVYYRCSQTKGYILPVTHTESFNLETILLRCLSTVLTEIESSSAMVWLVLLSDINRTILNSDLVKSPKFFGLALLL